MWPCARVQATSATLFDYHFFAELSGRVGWCASWYKMLEMCVCPPHCRTVDASVEPVNGVKQDLPPWRPRGPSRADA